ncbi:MAG: hypothetical protein MMC23_009260 [Stictis urceolatum]|nr:hypothetical protein [Stictis urceolata]
MATLLLRRPLTLGLGLTSAFTFHSLLQSQSRRPLLCETSTGVRSDSFNTYERDAKVPVIKNGKVNTAAYKQISSGSILGLLGGVAVSTFSKPLAFLIGLLVFGAQYLASKGINVLPTEKLQKYVKNVDLRSALEDNVAFKLSFGATFMLATFAEL